MHLCPGIISSSSTSISISISIMYYNYNCACVALGEKGLGKNVKHVLIRFRITDEALGKREITLEYLKTEDMVADILTKPLASKDFHRLRRVLFGERSSGNIAGIYQG